MENVKLSVIMRNAILIMEIVNGNVLLIARMNLLEMECAILSVIQVIVVMMVETVLLNVLLVVL